ncbi:hypothetical protein KIW84_030147 [Lathyrus oleraceus]|uniref:FACT complex subunit SSRP1 n=1 Tax=Pisum sativum TaxID=3888 RepID=A0A9D5AYI9_PEA|nr:hypothetical protein KIW84_030147 [Pisum sativum]
MPAIQYFKTCKKKPKQQQPEYQPQKDANVHSNGNAVDNEQGSKCFPSFRERRIRCISEHPVAIPLQFPVMVNEASGQHNYQDLKRSQIHNPFLALPMLSYGWLPHGRVETSEGESILKSNPCTPIHLTECAVLGADTSNQQDKLSQFRSQLVEDTSIHGSPRSAVSDEDVSQTNLQGKNDVVLEFHVDDTTGVNEEDSLMEMSFHIPSFNTQFAGDENHPSAQVFCDRIISMADVGAGGEGAVVTFDGIAILTPRGRYSVELHLSFLRLQGQANDFKIQYSSVFRLFLLPKSNQPHTFVIISLDPPIRKGQTLYPHMVMQFETDTVVDSELAISEDGYAVKLSLNAEDGILYPLEKSFFFLPKPPPSSSNSLQNQLIPAMEVCPNVHDEKHIPSPSSLQNTAPSKCQVSYHNCPCALACCKATIDIEPVMFAAAVRIATTPTSWKCKASSHHA